MNGIGGYNLPPIVPADSLGSLPDLSRLGPSPPQLTSASSYTDLQYLFGVHEHRMLAPKSNRNRRKSNHGTEQMKHRRTRSGCYTCRSRRVKCDEAHPICDRCKKGGRDCVYPETSTTKLSGSVASKSAGHSARESCASSSEDNDEEAGPERLEAIADESGDEKATGPRIHANSENVKVNTAAPGSVRRQTTRHSSETPSLVQDKAASPTPSTEGSIGYSSYQAVRSSLLAPSDFTSTVEGNDLRSDWSHLPPDLQFYLTYFYRNITYCHYSLKSDSSDFLRTTFLDAALRNQALLYAVVGFAAFQRTLHQPEGKIQDFLQYYNKAVSLLLKSLKKGDRHSAGTLLAILQLATIEVTVFQALLTFGSDLTKEFLGDWINLLGHQKAAYEILTELHTPCTVMEREMDRVILGWYMRFDVFAGLMGGFETVLSRDWFSFSHDFFQERVVQEPSNLNWKIERAVASHRLIARDMSVLFAKVAKGEISQEHFIGENETIARRIADWKTKMDPALQDSRYYVTDFSSARALDPNDIVDPYVPSTIFQGPLWVMNVATIDWMAIDLLHKYQTALAMKTQTTAELGLKAYATCQLFEACEFFPESPQGAVLACQASLGIACLFLPRDETHAMWARRKLATIESNGYIYPHTYRNKLADLFRDRSCMHWWLPNDESYPPIIRSIRKFVEERTTSPRSVDTEDLRDMKAIFSSLELGDGNVPLPQSIVKCIASSPNVSRVLEYAKLPIEPSTTRDMGLVDLLENDPYETAFQDSRGF